VRLKEIMSDKDRAKWNTPIYHFDSGDELAASTARTLLDLNEGQNPIDLGKGRSILYHAAHVKPGQSHLHFRVKGANVAALNMDGTAHDQSHGIKLQKWALDGMEKHFPNFKRPTDGLIEQFMTPSARRMLLEAADEAGILVSDEEIRIAEYHAAAA